MESARKKIATKQSQKNFVAYKNDAPTLCNVSLRINIVSACLLVFISFPALATLRLQDGEYCFCNKSTNEILVTRFFGDGKRLMSCGVLNPYQHASVSDLDMFPWTLPQSFQIEYQDSNGVTQTDKLDTAWIKLKKAKQGTVYFIYTPEKKFVLKIYLPADDDDVGIRLAGKLLPDESNPAFKSYKELIRASMNGNVQQVRELLTNGAPYAWPNEPESLTPLGLTVRWNQQKAFNVLINQLPQDFYPYEYYWCIRMAAQDGHTNILTRLLQSDFAKEIPTFQLRDIFYNACSHAKADNTKTNDIEVLKILLQHFNVGIDYKTSDYGHTLLFVAVQSDDAELVKWLLVQEANPNAKLQNGDTPLKWARSETVKKLLIDNGGK